MPDKPVIYILHGDDRLAIQRFEGELLRRMGDPSMAELNTSRLDGRHASLDDVRSAAYAMPFLAERRLVILTSPLSLAGPAAAQKRFIELLEGVPESTALVLVIHDELERGKWLVLGKHAWFGRWAEEHKPRFFWQACARPAQSAMPDWLRKQAKKMGGELSPEAAVALAGQIGSDTLLAGQELEKLLTYTNRARPVSAADVELLVSPGGQVGVFEVIDLIAAGTPAPALRLLATLLDQSSPSEVFALAIRQFRILIQVREVLDEPGGPGRVYTELPGTAFLNKYIQQAARFTLPALEATYHRLLEMDAAMKSSQLTPELALELLAVGG
jgi:DNA polymerase III subunit delta